MKWLCIVIFSMFFLFSCSEDKEQRLPAGPDILSKDTMEALFVDIHLAEVYLYQRQRKGMENVEYTKDVYRLLFKKYGLSYTSLQNNLRYYAEDPKTLQQIYDNVVNRLTRIEAEKMAQ